MKRTPAIILLLFLMSCQDDKTQFQSKGTITGTDSRFCACCGGFFITIGSEDYRFYSLPPGSNLDLESATFPVNVWLNWKDTETTCATDRIIEVSDIKRMPL